MQIVIDIPEEKYDRLMKQMQLDRNFSKCKITPLPKGHGRLIDASKLKVELECGIRAGNYEEGYENYAHINSMDDCIDAVEYADTVLEADKEREE